ncbi:MAG: hypothetical protein Q9190_007372 [Brigantiaea leucoxantha]
MTDSTELPNEALVALDRAKRGEQWDLFADFVPAWSESPSLKRGRPAKRRKSTAPLLMTLPFVIRRQIYILCLSVGKIYPYFSENRRIIAENSGDKKGKSKDVAASRRKLTPIQRPCTALLLVCKAIRAEAEPFLYSHNIVKLPTLRLSEKFLRASLPTRARRSWLRSIEVSLLAADLTTQERQRIAEKTQHLQSASSHRLQPHKQTTGAQRVQLVYNLHNACRAHLKHITWPRKIAPLLELDLVYLMVDLSDCACLYGCCYMNYSAMLAFNRGFVRDIPKILRFRTLATDQYLPEPTPNTMLKWVVDFTRLRRKKRLSLKQGLWRYKEILEGLEEDDRQVADLELVAQKERLIVEIDDDVVMS